MTETKKKPSLRVQGAWLLFAKVTGFAISFVLPLLIVRYLSKDDFGVYRQAFQFIINAVAILPIGFSMSAFYFLNRESVDHKAAVFNILLFNFFIGGAACVFLFVYPQFVGNIYQSEAMTALAPKIGVVIWLWIFSAFLEIVAIANQEARLSMVFIILAQLTKTLLMAGAVMIFTTVEAFMYAAMIQGGLQIILLLIYLNKRFPRFWLSFNSKFFREQAIYAIPFGFAGILWTLQTDIHTYFVGYRFSDAEYAIYSVGVFQLPLLGMLMESTGAVLISRMSELQSLDLKREIIELTVRAMQKLSFFYFPAYAFMLVTAYTFITTLYTERFAASVAIFVINLTLLPFDIWITDPIIRAYKQFGKYLMILRIFILTAMVAALWFGIQNFDLRGMIAIVIVTSIVERLITTSLLIKTLGIKIGDLKLLKGVAETALVAAVSGTLTYFIYLQLRSFVPGLVEDLAINFSIGLKASTLYFVSGMMILALSFAVFAPLYLMGMNLLGLIEDEEKAIFGKFYNRFTAIFGRSNSVAD